MTNIGGIMGSISGFGIGFAALTAALALSATNVIAAGTPTGNLDVSISGLRSHKGNVLVCLTANPKFFPNCSKDPLAMKQAVAAVAASTLQFHDVTPGTYALALIHDENANKKMDVQVFIPKEGFAFSRNPAVVFGPPKFNAASFVIGAGDSTQGVKMKYML